MTLLERISQPDLVDKPDWEVAEILNRPDESLPAIVYPNPTEAGIGTIMTIFGIDEGARILEDLSILATTNISVKWILRVIEGGKIDFSTQIVQDQIAALVSLGVISSEQAQAAIAYGQSTRYPSWSEHYGISVDARAVGLARGGI